MNEEPEVKKKMGRPVKHTDPQYRIYPRVNFATKAGLEAIASFHDCTISEAIECLTTYRHRDCEDFRRFATVYFKRGGDFALSVDGRVAINKETI